MREYFQTVVFILAVLGFVSCISLIIPKNGSPKNRNGKSELISLGTIDGKTIFYDNNYFIWDDAKKYCENQGMSLLEITTKEQQTFLEGKFSPGFFEGYYWISGRDSRAQSQFVWDNSGQPLTNVGQDWYSFYEQQSCVFYMAFNGKYNGYWQSNSCAGLPIFTLCEKKQ